MLSLGFLRPGLIRGLPGPLSLPNSVFPNIQTLEKMIGKLSLTMAEKVNKALIHSGPTGLTELASKNSDGEPN